MAWKLDSDRPIYAQLLEQIQMQILSHTYPAGSRLPSVRELAAEAGVNPNTMQRALTELERDGLLQTRRTAGRFVTEDTALLDRLRHRLAKEQIEAFVFGMKRLGYQSEEILALFTEEVEAQAVSLEEADMPSPPIPYQQKEE